MVAVAVAGFSRTTGVVEEGGRWSGCNFEWVAGLAAFGLQNLRSRSVTNSVIVTFPLFLSKMVKPKRGTKVVQLPRVLHEVFSFVSP